MPKVKRGFKVIHKRHDSEGNAIIFEQEYQFGNYRISLSLAAEGNRKRVIGEVDAEAKVLMVSRDRALHYHRMSRSYGFNREVIEKVRVFRRVLLMEKDGDAIDYYLIPDTVILKQGFKLNFVQQGFELQWFLAFDIIKQYQITNVKHEGGKLDISEAKKVH